MHIKKKCTNKKKRKRHTLQNSSRPKAISPYITLAVTHNSYNNISWLMISINNYHKMSSPIFLHTNGRKNNKRRRALFSNPTPGP